LALSFKLVFSGSGAGSSPSGGRARRCELANGRRGARPKIKIKVKIKNKIKFKNEPDLTSVIVQLDWAIQWLWPWSWCWTTEVTDHWTSAGFPLPRKWQPEAVTFSTV